jgi:hypothetical protein
MSAGAKIGSQRPGALKRECGAAHYLKLSSPLRRTLGAGRSNRR